MLIGQFCQLVVIDPLIVAAHAVGHNLIRLAGKVERMAVRQMAAMRQIHAEDRVAWLEHGRIGGLIGLRSGVWLHINIFGAEELESALAGQILHYIRKFAAGVIALAGITFGVLVSEDAAGGFED